MDSHPESETGFALEDIAEESQPTTVEVENGERRVERVVRVAPPELRNYNDEHDSDSDSDNGNGKDSGNDSSGGGDVEDSADGDGGDESDEFDKPDKTAGAPTKDPPSPYRRPFGRMVYEFFRDTLGKKGFPDAELDEESRGLLAEECSVDSFNALAKDTPNHFILEGTECQTTRVSKRFQSQIFGKNLQVWQVTILNLSKLDLEVCNVSHFINLQYLNLRDNRLKSLAATKVVALKKVKVLDVRDNRLSDANEILDVIESNNNLENICVSGNKLVKNHRWHLLLRIPKLRVSSVPFRYIDDVEIEPQEIVKAGRVCGRKADELEVLRFELFLNRMKLDEEWPGREEGLTLTSKRLQFIDMKQCSRFLTSVNLANNHINDQSLRQSNFGILLDLKYLDLTRNDIESGEELRCCLQPNVHLEDICVDGNPFYEEGQGHPGIDAMPSHQKRLGFLTMWTHGRPTAITLKCLNGWQITPLELVDIFEPDLLGPKQRSIIHVNLLMQKSQRWEAMRGKAAQLNLSNCQLSHLSSIARFTWLEFLDVSDNNLAVLKGCGLANLKNLSYLDIRNNQINGIMDIIQELQGCHLLKTLQMARSTNDGRTKDPEAYLSSVCNFLRGMQSVDGFANPFGSLNSAQLGAIHELREVIGADVGPNCVRTIDISNKKLAVRQLADIANVLSILPILHLRATNNPWTESSDYKKTFLSSCPLLITFDDRPLDLLSKFQSESQDGIPDENCEDVIISQVISYYKKNANKVVRAIEMFLHFLQLIGLCLSIKAKVGNSIGTFYGPLRLFVLDFDWLHFQPSADWQIAHYFTVIMFPVAVLLLLVCLTRNSTPRRTRRMWETRSQIAKIRVDKFVTGTLFLLACPIIVMLLFVTIHNWGIESRIVASESENFTSVASTEPYISWTILTFGVPAVIVLAMYLLILCNSAVADTVHQRNRKRRSSSVRRRSSAKAVEIQIQERATEPLESLRGRGVLAVASFVYIPLLRIALLPLIPKFDGDECTLMYFNGISCSTWNPMTITSFIAFPMYFIGVPIFLLHLHKREMTRFENEHVEEYSKYRFMCKNRVKDRPYAHKVLAEEQKNMFRRQYMFEMSMSTSPVADYLMLYPINYRFWFIGHLLERAVFATIAVSLTGYGIAQVTLLLLWTLVFYLVNLWHRPLASNSLDMLDMTCRLCCLVVVCCYMAAVATSMRHAIFVEVLMHCWILLTTFVFVGTFAKVLRHRYVSSVSGLAIPDK